MYRLIVILPVKSVSCIITSFFYFLIKRNETFHILKSLFPPPLSDVHRSTNSATVGLLKVKLMCEAAVDPGFFLGGLHL